MQPRDWVAREPLVDRASERGGVGVHRDVRRVVAAGLAEGGDVRADDRQAAQTRFEHRQAEAFVGRRQDERIREGVQVRELANAGPDPLRME